MNILLKFFVLFIAFCFPTFFLLAGNYYYQPLLPITMPNGTPLGNPNILEYLKNIYTFGIALVGGLAVIKIVYGGIVYMLSDVVTNKTEAVKEIQAAVVGLLVALGSATLLFTINPKLLTLNFSMDPTVVMEGDGTEFLENNEPAYTAGGAGGSVTGVVNPDATKINWANPNQIVYGNVTVRDLTKGSADRVPTDPVAQSNLYAMAQELTSLSAVWGGDFEIVSGYRPKAVNDRLIAEAKAKGQTPPAENSQHIEGTAFDIRPKNGDLAGLQQTLKQNWTGGVGVYGSFVHVDMRGGGGWKKPVSGTPARW
jgi:hypothetical protein